MLEQLGALLTPVATPIASLTIGAVSIECLDAADRARAEVAAASGEVRGRLAVGIIPGVAAVDVPAALREFHARHPHVHIRLVMAGSAQTIPKVNEGVLDIGFVGLPDDVEPAGVASHVLDHDRHVAVLAPGHRLAASKRLRLKRLAGETFVDFPAGGQGRAQTDRAFTEAGVRREVAFEVTDAYTMARLISHELAIALLPSKFVAQLAGVATVDVSDGPRRVEHVVWRRLGPSPAALAFLRQLGVNQL